MDIVVKVSGVPDATGMVGCGLFADANGFPLDNSVAKMQWLPADPKGVTCLFTEVTSGSYAVSVMQDLNANRKVDTNFLGMPQEAWGVSNNARPSLRPPRFDEAVFKVEPGRSVSLEIKVAK
ncbi:MAG: DUF2141 domain-containing protein [Burkholderiaceae bacterium]